MIGKIINNYKVTHIIGKGGMGVVYLAKHLTLQKKVAIKVLNTNYSNNNKVYKRFEEEAKTIDLLEGCEGIVNVLNYGNSNGHQYIIMEYVKGMSLDDYLKYNEILDKKEVLNYFTKILKAVNQAHKRGVIHRDLKPSNIMILPNDNIKIMDFGISKSYNKNNSLTDVGATIGTKSYMSPEQIKGDNKNVDFRSDIFSLGLIFFEMLTGKSPIKGKNNLSDYEITQKIIERPLPKLFGKNNDPNIQKIIDKATNKIKERRYQNIDSFLNDIYKLNGESRGEFSNKWSKYKHPILFFLLAILAIISAILMLSTIKKTNQKKKLIYKMQKELKNDHIIEKYTIKDITDLIKSKKITKNNLAILDSIKLSDYKENNNGEALFEDFKGIIENFPVYKEKLTEVAFKWLKNRKDVGNEYPKIETCKKILEIIKPNAKIEREIIDLAYNSAITQKTTQAKKSLNSLVQVLKYEKNKKYLTNKIKSKKKSKKKNSTENKGGVKKIKKSNKKEGTIKKLNIIKRKAKQRFDDMYIINAKYFDKIMKDYKKYGWSNERKFRKETGKINSGRTFGTKFKIPYKNNY